MVKIRLSRIGKKHRPWFRIVAVDSRKKRDGECLDNLGTYDPLKGEMIQFNKERMDYWLSQGAQQTDSVKKICRAATASKPVKKAAKPAKAKVVEAVEKQSTETATEAQ